jgi:putative tricarboxylic transport membrane protein
MYIQLDYLGIGLISALDPLNLSMMIVGLTIGILAGALPGITTINAIVLVLPFTYLMGIVPAVILMTSIYCGGVFGGSITGILFNIPGDPMNVPTTWEGYQLNKKGFVSKALGMAIITSAIGGFLSALVLTFASPPFAGIALSFSSLEYFGIIFLGLASVVVIGTQSTSNAFISLFIGMLLGSVGLDEIYGIPRFTFGFHALETGINFITVLIGLFAIGEVLEMTAIKSGSRIEKLRTRPKTRLPRINELWSLRYSIFRGFGIGLLIGAIPGAGATVASFVSYGVEKQVSKHPEKFGTGVWEGLAASETSVNASTGGAMIPLLTLGIPGSGATAVIMGAFLLHGIQPGPLLFTKSPEIVWTIFVSMILCNLIMILVGLIAAKFFSEAMRIPENILGAFIISFCLIGAFALRNNMADVWTMAIFGVIGFYMRRYALPIPPLVLGLILGPLAENYFLTTMIKYHNNFFIFFQHPLSATILIVSVGLLLIPVFRKSGSKEATP